MADNLTLDLEDQADQDEQQKLARIAAARPDAVPMPKAESDAVPLGKPQDNGTALIASPPSPASANALELPKLSPDLGKRRSADEAELQRVASTGSGISQLPRLARIPLHVLDTIGSAIAPGTASLIPGTELHHEAVLGGLRRNIGKDIEEQGKEAQAAEQQATAQSKLNPPPKTLTNDEQTYNYLLQQINPETGKPYTPFEVHQKMASGAVEVKNPPIADLAGVNQRLTNRWHVLNPGQALPGEYTLKPGATQEDYKQIDADLQKLEQAKGTKAQQDEVNQMRKDAAAATAQDRASRQQDREQAKSDKKDAADKAFYEKNIAPLKASLDFADNYLQSGSYSGPNDDTLMLQYFELAKPETGFRLTQSEIARQNAAQSWRNSLSAWAHHAATGTWFSDTQRKEIVEAMHEIGEAKQKALEGYDRAGASSTAQSGGASGETKAPPTVGTVEQGYRFKGGNPADQNNWEKVK